MLESLCLPLKDAVLPVKDEQTIKRNAVVEPRISIVLQDIQHTIQSPGSAHKLQLVFFA
jgi:hypothetical protein